MKLNQFLNEASPKKKQILKKYMNTGNTFKPVGEIETVKELEAGIYNVKNTMTGPEFEIHEVHTDELLTFNDERYVQITEEIDRFWGLREDFKKMGMTHKRGVLLYGKPGTGKSCLLKQIMESSIKEGNVVLIVKDAYALVSGLKQLKEVEKNRKVLVVFEDIDEVLRYGGERSILELFDGDSQSNNILYLATTNYPERLPERMLRANRFDRKIEIGNPPFEGRKAYFNSKLKKYEDNTRIEELANKTDGFTFAQLREFVVATYCLKQNEDEVIKRLKGNFEPVKMTESEMDEKLANYIVEDKPVEEEDFLKEMGL